MLNLLSQRHTWKEAPPQMPMNGLQKQNGFNEFGPMTYPLGPPIGYGPQIFPQPQQYPPQPGRNQPNIEPPSVFPQIGLPRPTSVPNFKVQSPPPPPQIPQMRPPPMRIPNRPMMPPPNALPRRGMMWISLVIQKYFNLKLFRVETYRIKDNSPVGFKMICWINLTRTTNNYRIDIKLTMYTVPRSGRIRVYEY